MIYIIEEIWFDSMENEVSAAVGYNVVGYLNSEDEAKEFCKDGAIFTNKDCWAVYGKMPQYKYKELKNLN